VLKLLKFVFSRYYAYYATVCNHATFLQENRVLVVVNGHTTQWSCGRLTDGVAITKLQVQISVSPTAGCCVPTPTQRVIPRGAGVG